MKRLSVFVLFWIMQLTPAQSQDCNLGTDQPLTAMTYNIRVGYGAGREGINPFILALLPKRIDPIIAAIKDLDPDVLAIQEVTGPSQVNRIAEALGMNVAMGYHPSPVRWWGLALLSRCPIIKSQSFQTSSGRGNARSTLRATVDIGPAEVDFVVYHRDPDVNDGTQGLLLEQIARSGDNPVVVLGDFNLQPRAKRMTGILAAFDDTGAILSSTEAIRAREQGTLIKREGRRIDYVLTEKGWFEILETGLTDKRYDSASDHRGYYAKFLLTR